MSDETDGDDDVFWSMDQTLNWITFRRPSSIDQEARRDKLYRALMFDRCDQEGVVESSPARVLKLRLEEGRITAHSRDGSQLAPAFWAHRSFDKNSWPPVVFRKDDVVIAFPASDPDAALQTPPAPPAPLSIDRLSAEIKDVYANTKATGKYINKGGARVLLEEKFGAIRDKMWNGAFKVADVRAKSGRPRKATQKLSEKN